MTTVVVASASKQLPLVTGWISDLTVGTSQKYLKEWKLLLAAKQQP
jgi:hypothetical protein